MPDRTLIDLLEEVVAFVIDEDEGGEILDGDFPDGFHAEFGVGDYLLRADVILRQQSGGATGGTEIEAAEFFAGIGDLLGTVAFG